MRCHSTVITGCICRHNNYQTTNTGVPWHANGPRLVRPLETWPMEIQKLVRLEGGPGPQKMRGLSARASEPAPWTQQARSFQYRASDSFVTGDRVAGSNSLP